MSSLSENYGAQRLCLRSGGTLKRFIVPRDQTLNEDNTLNLHVTPPLRKHFVVRSGDYLNFSLNLFTVKISVRP